MPVLIVFKKNGESRMVVDYRRPNANTIRQPYPLPNVDDLLELFCGCTLFSVLDLAHGFLQNPLTNRAKEHTAFITPDKTGQFTCMVFDLTNAPFEFLCIMDKAIFKKQNCAKLL